MAIERMTYLDIPLDVRKEKAQVYRTRIRESLKDPFLLKAQRDELEGKLKDVGAWVLGEK